MSYTIKHKRLMYDSDLVGCEGGGECGAWCGKFDPNYKPQVDNKNAPKQVKLWCCGRVITLEEE